MWKRSLWVLFSVLVFPATLSAAEPISVLILPFEVHAQRSPDHLREQIRHLVEKRLTAEGITVVEPPVAGIAAETDKGLGLEYFRRLGKEVAADFVVYGSFTQIGTRFSLDAKVIEAYSDGPPQTAYVEGLGTEEIMDSLATLAGEIAMRVLSLEKVVEVAVSGNKRIEPEAIKRILKTKGGELYSAANIREDVKAIYKMGYFGDVRVDVTAASGGKLVTFLVEEKETVRHIRMQGNRKFEDKKIQEVLGTRSGAILNVNTLEKDLREIEKLYKEKGYHNVDVAYEIESAGQNQADVEFVINEGEKIYVQSISFDGNTSYDDDTLKEQMKTQEKGFFSWFTSSGDLDREVLDQDMSKIAAYYHNHGYIQARVGEPSVVYEKESISISVKIDEGSQFKVGKVRIEGELIQSEEELLGKIKIKKEAVYNREVVREDILTLADLYSDEGYAYADISPRIEQREAEHEADITYVINKGALVYFEKIIIAGNTKTRDKVIRRELLAYEQELFSGKAVKKGTRNLYRLDYFEDIKVNTSQGSADDKMIVKLDVTEKPTGSFSFGGGYSSVDRVFAMAAITQRNLFGKGQILSLRGQVGSRTTDYTLSFTEPWLFDIPLSAGFDLYNTSHDYDTYDKDSVGGTLRASYPVLEDTRAYFSYNYDLADIENLTSDASYDIREFEGENEAHTVSTTLRRDTRDRIFEPTEGSDNGLTIEHAGTPFGGDIGFTKYTADSGWYIPLFWDTVGMIHGRTGFIGGDGTGKVPTWERFYMGGMNSIRGYDWREISPVDPVTGDEIGGNKMIQFNLEFLFPIIKKSGLRGVIFYDTGNVYDNGEKLELSNLRESIGYGFRWYSPIGPIRLEYGYILDSERKGEGGWEFSMGMAF